MPKIFIDAAITRALISSKAKALHWAQAPWTSATTFRRLIKLWRNLGQKEQTRNTDWCNVSVPHYCGEWSNLPQVLGINFAISCCPLLERICSRLNLCGCVKSEIWRAYTSVKFQAIAVVESTIWCDFPVFHRYRWTSCRSYLLQTQNTWWEFVHGGG